MLKIHFKDNRREAIWVVDKNYAIGSHPDNNLVINDRGVDAIHARLITQHNKLYLKDNHSSSGSYINGQRVTQKQIQPGDLIRLGEAEIQVMDPRESLSQPALTDEVMKTRWKLVADSSWLSGQEYLIEPEVATIGRASDCDIIIPGTHLSRRHAELSIKDNLLHIRDLASANGTFINDERIHEGTARPGDRLRLDVYSFRIIGPADANDRTQLRRPNHQSYTPIEQQALGTATTKHWKTKPTSPGNRVEPETPSSQKLISAISVVLLLTMIAVITWLFIA